MQDNDESDGELIVPEDFLAADPMPHDARRMGFDRYSDQGALIALAAALDPAKPSHKAMAWLMLAVVIVPLVVTLVFELF